MPEQNLDALASAFRDVRGADEDALWLAEASAYSRCGASTMTR